MAIRFSTGERDSVADKIVLDFADGVIDLYDGSQPASSDDVPNGNKIGSVTESGGTFAHGSAANGLEIQSNSDGTISIKAGESWRFTSTQAGTVTWGRFKTNAPDSDASSTTQKRMDFSVGVTTGNMKIGQGVTFTAASQTADISTFSLNIAAQGSN